MSELSSIQTIIQSCSAALAGLLQVEVTVVDSSLRRIAGTGIFAARIGEHIADSSAFQNALSSGSANMVRDVSTDHVCSGCAKRDECRELANIAHPIFFKGKVLGVIGIAAFQAQARARLWREADNLKAYLDAWSRLIESRVRELDPNDDGDALAKNLLPQNISGGMYAFLSPSVIPAFDLANRVSATDSSILITGESGSGKEVLACMIHDSSPRRMHPMVCINCGAIPQELIESELFGYEAGAFTGALRKGKAGKFELADSGTIFLDEIGDLPLPAQTRLLRVLQEHAVDRLGGDHPVPVDVRVISATNKDLKQMVAKGLFREDLYYRLCVIPIELPPLRQRKEDIIPMAYYFLNHYNYKFKKNIRSMSQDVKKAFQNYSWPGNIREMKNAIEYIANIANGDVIEYSDLPQYITSFFTYDASEDEQKNIQNEHSSLAEIMRSYEHAVLARMVSQAGAECDKESLARRLGISRATLYRKLSVLGLAAGLGSEKASHN